VVDFLGMSSIIDLIQLLVISRTAGLHLLYRDYNIMLSFAVSGRVGVQCQIASIAYRVVVDVLDTLGTTNVVFTANVKMCQSHGIHCVLLQVRELWTKRNFALTYSWIHNVLRSVVPLCIMCTVSCFIVYALRRSSRHLAASRGHYEVHDLPNS